MRKIENPRVLGVVRLSNLTDTTSSPERQRAKIEGWAKLHDGAVVGIAEDLDVSAIKVSPFERPALKAWLSKPDEYDVIVAWKLDRLARKTKDFLELIEWANEHKIRVVTVEESFDLGNPAGRMVATVLAAFAEYEGEVIRERIKDAYKRNVKAGNWRGGVAPYGYRPVSKGDHWELEHDPETKEILQEVVTRIIDGESASSVVRDLNTRKVRTSLDVQRIRQGKEPKGSPWRSTTLLNLLRSKALLGQYEAAESESSAGKKAIKKTIIGEDGLPLQRAEPLITNAEWEALHAKLNKNSQNKTKHRKGGCLLRQVAFCAVCGMPMYRVKGQKDYYYRCSSISVTAIACGNISAKAVDLEEILEASLLGEVGKLERKTKVFIPGEDHTQELEQVIEAMSDARKERDRGDYDYPGGAEEYNLRIQKLSEKRKHLASLPQVPSRTEWVGTGEKFAEYWATLDENGKGAFYRQAGIRIDVLRWPGGYAPAESVRLPQRKLVAKTITYAGKETALFEPVGPKTRTTPMSTLVAFGDLKDLYNLAEQVISS